jgi:hypothetical protein
MGPFDTWYEALEQRHLAHLTFQEVRKAVQALSQVYVQKRLSLKKGADLNTQGKRAAFALYYTPMHVAVAHHILQSLQVPTLPSGHHLYDCGCGTGAGALAWALHNQAHKGHVHAYDLHRWVLQEAAWNFGFFNIDAHTYVKDITRIPFKPNPQAIVSAYTLNELEESQRNTVTDTFLHHAQQGAHVLVIEPISNQTSPWWNEWEKRCIPYGGTTHTWRFQNPLPQRWKLMDKAAGLDHAVLTAKSMYLKPI